MSPPQRRSHSYCITALLALHTVSVKLAYFPSEMKYKSDQINRQINSHCAQVPYEHNVHDSQVVKAMLNMIISEYKQLSVQQTLLQSKIKTPLQHFLTRIAFQRHK